MTVSYKSTYDFFAYGSDKKTGIVIEFKSKLRKIISDLKARTKSYIDIDCIVCWGVDDEDRNEMRHNGLKLVPLQDGTELIPSATHRLEPDTKTPFPVTHDLYIIDLKAVLDRHTSKLSESVAS